MRVSDHPSHRSLETARKHLDHARFAAEAGFHAQACFNAQQAAEKAVKAVHYAKGAPAVLGSGFRQLIEDLNTPSLAVLLSAARQLDLYYIPTRYPNRLDDATHEEAFSSDQSLTALDLAQDNVTAAAQIIHASARNRT